MVYPFPSNKWMYTSLSQTTLQTKKKKKQKPKLSVSRDSIPQQIGITYYKKAAQCAAFLLGQFNLNNFWTGNTKLHDFLCHQPFFVQHMFFAHVSLIGCSVGVWEKH